MELIVLLKLSVTTCSSVEKLVSAMNSINYSFSKWLSGSTGAGQNWGSRGAGGQAMGTDAEVIEEGLRNKSMRHLGGLSTTFPPTVNQTTPNTWTTWSGSQKKGRVFNSEFPLIHLRKLRVGRSRNLHTITRMLMTNSGPRVTWDSLLSVQSLSRVWLLAIPWTAAHQASLSRTVSQSLPKCVFFESVMPSNHLTLRCRLLLLSVFPSIRAFSNESAWVPAIAIVIA